MSHLLIDCDSKIPNLALMKISAYLKRLGEEVVLLRLMGKAVLLPKGPWEKVWCSVVFTWNRRLAESCKSYFEWLRIPVALGGSGVSLEIRLPDYIETLAPDYELYGDDRAIGFIQRGCIRACDFCIVNKKEGWLSENKYNPLASWVPEGFTKVLLLDNEFAAFPEDEREREELARTRNWHFQTTQETVLEEARSRGWKLSITQGYDLRCMTALRAKLLAGWKPWDLKFRERRLYCAWDYLGIGPAVRRGLAFLVEAGFRPIEITCYILVGKNTSHLQDYYRVHVLWKECGVLPFVMRYNLRRDDMFLNALGRYVNRPGYLRSQTFVDYCKAHVSRHGKHVLDEAEEVTAHCEAGKPVPLDIPYSLPPMASYY